MIRVMVTAEQDVEILGCVRCDTAVLPVGRWPGSGAGSGGGAATAGAGATPAGEEGAAPGGEEGAPAAPGVRCPLCGWHDEVAFVEVGDAFRFNPQEQEADAASTPIYRAGSVTVDEDMVLIDVPGLLDDPAFHALQNGVAPVAAFGWVGGEGLLGSEEYRLFLIVRVSDLEEQDLFRVEFPAELVPELAQIDGDRTAVLVSGRKGVLFAEAGEIYLQAVQEAGARPGDRLTISEWAYLQD